MAFVVATVLTVYGIETLAYTFLNVPMFFVATVLTVYGIETRHHLFHTNFLSSRCNSTYRLRY